MYITTIIVCESGIQCPPVWQMQYQLSAWVDHNQSPADWNAREGWSSGSCIIENDGNYI